MKKRMHYIIPGLHQLACGMKTYWTVYGMGTRTVIKSKVTCKTCLKWMKKH